MTSSSRSVLPHILIVGLLVLVLDFVTKLLVIQYIPLGHSIEVIPGFFNLHHIKNSGAAFGIGNQWSAAIRLPFFIVVFAVATWVLYSFYKRCTPEQTWLKLSVGLVGGGALGNMLDRLMHRRVTDFINWHIGDYHWPFFNIADMAITVGVAMLFIEVWIFEGRQEAQQQQQQPAPSTGP